MGAEIPQRLTSGRQEWKFWNSLSFYFHGMMPDRLHRSARNRKGSRMKTSKQFAAACMLGLALSAQAGVTIVQSWQKLGDKSAPMGNTIHVEKDRIRVENGSNPDQQFIYRGDKKLLWIVNLKEKTYMEMTEKDFTEMFAKRDEAMKKMKAQLAQMPPEQRKMMEDMMAKMYAGGPEAPKTEFRKTGSGGKINGWSTDKYEAVREGGKKSDIWVSEYKTLGISESEVHVFKDLARYFEKIAPTSEWQISDKGMPVKSLTYKDGKPEFQMEVKEVKKENQPASLFEVPAGMTQKKMGKAG
jgi:hypothetical protein